MPETGSLLQRVVAPGRAGGVVLEDRKSSISWPTLSDMFVDWVHWCSVEVGGVKILSSGLQRRQ